MLSDRLDRFSQRQNGAPILLRNILLSINRLAYNSVEGLNTLPQAQFTTDTTIAEVLRIIWLRRNYGVMRRIAEDLHVTPPFVSLVFHGHRRSARVERALREVGAPLEQPLPVEDSE